jgi:hypothetical protein
MSEPKFGSGRRRLGRYIAGNPLWPLEELRNVRNPRLVADPEFLPCDIDAVDRRKAPASPNDAVHLRPSKHVCQRGIPLPHLVVGLPWRFTGDTERPIVAETDFVPLDLHKLPVSAGSGQCQ